MEKKKKMSPEKGICFSSDANEIKKNSKSIYDDVFIIIIFMDNTLLKLNQIHILAMLSILCVRYPIVHYQFRTTDDIKKTRSLGFG